MSAYGNRLIEAGRQYVDQPFRHHFEPDNLCENGRITIDACMENGLGQSGKFDCSGLGIVAACHVLRMRPEQWPREYRHSVQLAALIEERFQSSPGDIAIFFFKNRPDIHMGILTAIKTVIHASGRTQRVEEGEVLGDISRVRIIPAEKLLEIGLEAQNNS